MCKAMFSMSATGCCAASAIRSSAPRCWCRSWPAATGPGNLPPASTSCWGRRRLRERRRLSRQGLRWKTGQADLIAGPAVESTAAIRRPPSLAGRPSCYLEAGMSLRPLSMQCASALLATAFLTISLPAAAGLQVQFIEPERYTDAHLDRSYGTDERVLQIIERHLQGLAGRCLGPGDALQIRVLDID